MLKKYYLAFLLFLGLVPFLSSAQGMEQGIKFIGYGKNKSALEFFKKLHEGGKKNANVTYWLGQAYLANDDVAGARDIYQKALQSGINDPLVIVGMGHVDLLESNNINAARQKFEQAITMAKETSGKNKGKTNPAVLGAIGRANADGGSKIGNRQFGIDKLKEAVLTDNSADTYLNMGICYLKLGADQGGEAVKAYMEAAAKEPANPLPYYRIGRIYLSQNNKDLFEENFNKAISLDPTFPLAYLSLYDYYAYKNVKKAREYIESYIQNADKSCETEFFYANYLFIAGQYKESLNKGLEMSKGECASYPKTKLLLAYDYDRLGDSVKAYDNIVAYLAKEGQSKTVVSDYEIATKIASRFPGKESEAVGYLRSAIELDSNKLNRYNYCIKAAEIMEKAKNYAEQLAWLQKAMTYKPGSWGEIDYFKISNAAMTAKEYQTLLDLSAKYIAAFPDKPQGYSFGVKAAKNIDTGASLGTAVGPIELQNAYFAKDTAKNRKSIFQNLYYLLVYYNDKAKNTAKAIEICDNMLLLYPAAGTEENAFAIKTKAALEKDQAKEKSPVVPTKSSSPANSKPKSK